jgi:hypothetical protein
MSSHHKHSDSDSSPHHEHHRKHCDSESPHREHRRRHSESNSSDSSHKSEKYNNIEIDIVKVKRGHRGRQGCPGPQGIQGEVGPQGIQGEVGPQGIQGEVGPQGIQGEVGPQGIQGTAGSNAIVSYADFYALMPGDNLATIAVGGDVQFPSDGPFLGPDIIRVGPSSFGLQSIGTYQILFQVSVDEAGQLVVTLNNLEQTYTTVGRATGTSQLVGICLIQTTTINNILTIRNPAGNSTALTITPLAGGANSVSAHLVITRLN